MKKLYKVTISAFCSKVKFLKDFESSLDALWQSDNLEACLFGICDVAEKGQEQVQW